MVASPSMLNFRLLLELKSSRQGEFHPKPLTEPYLIVSHHTALVVLKVMLHENHAANVQKYLDNF